MPRIIILAIEERPGRTALIAALILALAASSISGIVQDASGGVVSGASVIIRVESGPEQRVTTGPDGRFSVDVAEARDATVIVRAGGFAEKQERVTDLARPLQIVLAPAQLLEQVTVTASRTEQRLGDIPASINVIHAEEIRMSPAVVADDVLRAIPTFSLFRRTSSLSSHPTAQGVSLRGIGPSGVSRTLVLVDGAPFNDPFGGWVYWTRVPLESVDRIEVVDGSSSSLYGNYAMGGVINIVTSRAARRTHRAQTAVRQSRQPEAGLLGLRCLGQGRCDGRRQPVQHRRLPDRRAGRARPDRQQRHGEVPEFQRQGRLSPDRPAAGVRPGRLLRRGSGQRQDPRGERHAVEVGERRRAGSGCPTRAICR